jgi:putative redox protein
MKVEIKRVHKAFGMDATNEHGATVKMDCTNTNGENAYGASPMELLLMGIGGCSSIDLEVILTKMHQNIENISATIEAEKEKVEQYNIFKTINIHYIITGDVDAEKVEKAINMSLGTYCSVAKILEKTAKISATFSINKSEIINN